MIGSIIGIEENEVLVKLSIDISKTESLINLHVIMDDGKRQIIGEVIDITDNVAKINLLGEMIDGKFVFGVIVKPSFSSKVNIISKEKIPMIIGVEDYKENVDLYLGNSPIYNGIKIGVNINSFFANHFAILGSTGSGKSCGVARIIQNIFAKQQYVPYRASLFIFDAYGEYHAAFKEIAKINPDISFKAYTTNLHFSESEILRIPLWLLSVDDIALLLEAEKPSQLSIIEKALKLVNIFVREGDDVI